MKILPRIAFAALFVLSATLLAACEREPSTGPQGEVDTVRYRSLLEEAESATNPPAGGAVMTVGSHAVSKRDLEKWLNTSETRHLRSLLGEQMGIDTLLKQVREFHLIIYDAIDRGVLGERALGARMENFEIVAFGNYYLKRYLVPKTKGEIKGGEISGRMLYRDRSVRVSMIGLGTLEEARKALKELREGRDFAALARERSILPYAKEGGGDLGFLGYDNHYLPEHITTIVFSDPKKGYLSEVFKNPLGYCIVKVEDVRYHSPDEIVELAERLVSHEANERSVELLDHILDDVEVTVNEDLLGRLPAMEREELIENYGQMIGRLGGKDISVERFIYFLQDHYYKGSFSLSRDLESGLKAYQKYMAAAEKLSELGISIDDEAAEFIRYREKKMVYDYVVSKIKEGLAPSEDDLRGYFDKNRASFDVMESLKLRLIMVSSLKKAEDIHALLEKDPESFAHLAAQYSEDGSKTRGGEVGFVSRDRMKQDLWDAAISLNDGGFSRVVSDEAGYFILKREGYTPAKKARYEEVREQVRDKFINERFRDEYGKIIARLERKYDVAVNTELIKNILD